MRVEHRSLRHDDGSVEVRLYFPTHEDWTDTDPAPARHLAYLALFVNGTLTVETHLGPAVAPQPFFGFRLAQAPPGGILKVVWRTNRDRRGSLEITLP